MGNRTFAAFMAGLLILTGCTSVDRTAAANLGLGGQAATQTLSAEASDATQTLSQLSLWWGVSGVLNCVSVKSDLQQGCIAGAAKPADATLQQNVAKLSDAMRKRKRATDTLNQAYGAFVDLAKYNAGQDASTALKASFSDINGFLTAASALDPAAAPLPAISTTFETVAGGGFSLFADNRQNEQILKANRALKDASQALYEGLSRERAAMSNILGTLGGEKAALYDAALGAGLISPVDVLSPVIVQAYPSTHVGAPPTANQAVVLAAAELAAKTQGAASVDAVAKSYVDALQALSGLAKQHDALAETNKVTLSSVELSISNLKSDLAANAAPTPAPTASAKN